MIEPEGNNASRPPVDLQKQADFRELVLWACSNRGHAKELYAYQLYARNSANQRGRELKTSMRRPGSEILASQDRTACELHEK